VLKLLVFDLDGTLADTSHDLAVSVNHALTHEGHSPLPLGTVVGFLGDGARTLIMRSLMASGNGETSPGEIDDALESFLENYSEHCLGETKPYPGLVDSLKALGGLRKVVLTNKPDAPAHKVMEGLGLAPYFKRIVGGDNPFGKKPEPGALWEIMEMEGVSAAETVVIGDGVQDHQVAKRAGTHFLGFIGGLAPKEALLKEKPEASIAAMSELPAAISAINARIGSGKGKTA
jgi:phosphoglycolate phosphatase